MFGIGGAIKAIAALIIVVVIAGGVWYVTGLRADLAVSEANSAKLQEGIQQQQALMEQMREDIATIQKTNAELSAQNERQKKDVESLSRKFDKRDIGALAAEKPEVIEKLVNRGSVNALRCLELASGAPLNDKEKSAKTPTEANRECPGLIDSDYTAPVR
jgi:hypothetical protein